MEIRGKKLLVIGGAGLIGSHTVDKLLEQDVAQVVIYDNFARGRQENLGDALRDDRGQDLRDRRRHPPHRHSRRCDAGHGRGVPLRRAVAAPVPRISALARSTSMSRGTFNVMDACVRNGIKRLVYSSSASVYGDAVTDPMEEDHPFNNQNFYGATKICGEAMLRAYHHRYGLDYVGLRYMNVYGPAAGLSRGVYRGDHENARRDRPGRCPDDHGRRVRSVRFRRGGRLRARQRLCDGSRRQGRVLQCRHGHQRPA